MDHSHRDRTYKKSRFQQELEQSVSRKLISSLLLGCLLFCIAIAAVNALSQNARREDHLESVAFTFHEVYNNTSAFLLDAGHTELFLSELRNDQDNLRYLISHYNVSALVEIQLILTDSKGNVRFTTFSEGEMNLHRQEFNGIAVDNACHLMRAVYTTVYHFRANSSEYVMIHPLYRDGEYQGAVAVYLNENDWTKLFSQYQYDAILTKSNGDVITCSNSLLPLPEERQQVSARRCGAVCASEREPLSTQQPLAGKRHGVGLLLHLLAHELQLSFRGSAPDRTAGTELGSNVRPYYARYD